MLLANLFQGLFFALAAVSLYKLVLAMSQGQGLLASRVGGGAEPERVQLVVLTLVAAATYASQCLATLKTGRPQLVEPDTWVTAMTGASNLAYMVGKTVRLT
jgi:hypothetical protein